MKHKFTYLLLMGVLLLPFVGQAQQTIPYSESFDGMTTYYTPTGWTHLGNGSSQVTGSYRCGSTGYGVYFSGATTNNVLVMPQLAVDISTVEMAFQTRPEGVYASCGQFDVGYVTNVGDVTSFVAVETYSYSDADFASGCADKLVDFADAPSGSRIAFRHRSESNSYYWYIDNVSVTTATGCRRPSGLMASAVDATSATISWDAVTDAVEYLVTMGSNTYSTTQNSYSLSGLTPLTGYTVSVRTVCSTDTSRATSVSFQTACSTLPYTQNFESMTTSSTTLPAGWSRVQGSVSYVNSTHNYNGGVSLKFAGSATYLFALPAMPADISALKLTFQLKPESNSTSMGPFDIGYYYDNTFYTVQTILYTDFSSVAYQEFEATFAGAPSGALIALRSRATNNMWWFVDEINVDSARCIAPGVPAVASVGDYDATLYWPASTMRTNYQYLAVLHDSTANWNNALSTTDTFCTLSGLQPYTNYDFYVRSYCGATEQTGAKKVSFMTAPGCGTAYAMVQPTLGAESSTNYYAPFYSYYSSFSGTDYTCGGTWEIFNAEELAEADIYAGEIKGLAWKYATSTSYPATFKIYMANTDKRVFTSSTDTIPRDSMKLVYTGTYNFRYNERNEIHFDSSFTYDGRSSICMFVLRTAPVTSSLYFYYDNTSTRGYNTIYRYGPTTALGSYGYYGSSYRVSTRFTACSTIPSCWSVQTFTLTGVTDTTATLAWTDTRNSGATYSIRCENVMTGDTTWEYNVSGNSFVFGGLSGNTVYNFSIVADCGTSTSDLPKQINNVRTACGEMAIPYTEGFEGYTSSIFPYCWNSVVTYTSYSTNYPYVYYNATTSAHSGSGCLYFYSYGSSNYTLSATPLVPLSSDQIHVMFWAKVPSTTPNFQAGVMTDRTRANTFIPLLTVTTGDGTWREYEFYTDTITADSVYVAFRWQSDNGSYFYIDDITIEQSSLCRRPVNGRIYGLGHDQVSFAWEDNGTNTSNYVLRVSAENTMNSTTILEYATNDLGYTVTQLHPSTTYYAWVATVCNGDTTSWLSLGSFTTRDYCYPVINYSASSVGYTNAALTWQYDTVNGVTGGSVRIALYDVTASDTVARMTVTGTSTFVNNLTPGRSYRAYLTTLCGDSATRYSRTISFTTLDNSVSCGEVSGTTTSTLLPFSPNYDYGYSQIIYPSSLVSNYDSITAIAFNNTTTASYQRILDIYIDTTTRNTFTTTDYITPSRMKKVKTNFSHYYSSTGWTVITFDTAFRYPGAGNLVIAVVNKSGDYQTFNFSAHTDNNYNGVYWRRDNTPYDLTSLPTPSGTTNTVPDLRIFGNCPAPTCFASTPMITSAGTNSIHATWLPNGTESSWVVAYRPYGTTSWTYATTTTDTGYTITSLAPATRYEIRIGSLCTNDTLWTSILSQYTSCQTMTVPYAYGFENEANYDFPFCWTKTQSYSSYPYVNVASSNAHGGNNSLYFYATSSSPNMVATQLVPLNSDEIFTSFYFKSSSSYGQMQGGVVTNPGDPDSFIPLITINADDSTRSWKEYFFTTNSLSITESVAVAFRWTGSSYGAYIDDISISQLSECERPSNPIVSNVSYYSADLRWTDANNGTATFDILYGTGNSTEDPQMQLITSFDTFTTLTGLTQNTTYHAWVRASCYGDGTAWLPFPTFTTQRTCYDVVNARVVATRDSAVALGWDFFDGGIVPTEVIITYTDLTTSSSRTISVTGNAAFLTGLTPGHNYRADLRTVCSTDTASTVSVTFMPMAAGCGEIVGTATSSYMPITASYEYSISEVIYPAANLAGIDSITGVSYYLNSAVSSSPYSRTVDVYMANTTRTSVSEYDFILASSMKKMATGATMNLSSTGWITITFDSAFVHNGTDNIVVAVVNRTGDWSSGAVFRAHTATVGNGAYWFQDEYSLSLNSSSLYADYDGTSTTVPDIRFEGNCAQGSCPAPMPVVEAVDTNSASIAWLPGSNETRWVVEYKLTSSNTWTYAGTATASPFTVTGLTPATQYTFRVGAICGNDTVFANTQSQFTDCAPVHIPFTQMFTSTISNCWNTTSNFAAGSGYYILRYATGQAITPEVAAPLNTLQVRVVARSSSASAALMAVGTTSGDGAVVTWIDTISIPTSSTVFAEEVVYLNGYSGSDNRVVLAGVNSSTYIYMQSMTLEPMETCFVVDSLRLSNITDTSVTLSWQHAATQFEIQYKRPAESTWQSTFVSASPATVTGLMSASNYDIRVRAICTATDSSRWIRSSFSTQCGLIRLPWTEDFESLTTGSSNFPRCWTRTQSYYDSYYYETYPYIYSYAADAHSGSNMVDFYVSSSYPNMISTPTIAAPANRMHVSFWVKMPSSSSASLQAGIITNPNQSSTFRPVMTISGGNTDWARYTFTTDTVMRTDSVSLAFRAQGSYDDIYLDDITVQLLNDCPLPLALTVDSIDYNVARIRWQNSSLNTRSVVYLNGNPVASTMDTFYLFTGLTPDHQYTVGVATLCTQDTSLAITTDLTTAKSCYPVQNASIASVGATTATVTWSFFNQGITPTETLIRLTDLDDASAPVRNITTTNTYYIFTGLQQAHRYSVELRTVCQSDSAQVITRNFSTMPIACATVSGTTSSYYLPIYANSYGSNYHSFAEMLYPASVFTGVDTVTSLSWNINYIGTPSYNITQQRTIDVYMAKTNISTALSSSNYVDQSNLKLVASNKVIGTSDTGWVSIALDSTFVCDGTSNVVIAVMTKTAGCNYLSFRSASVTGGSSQYWYSTSASDTTFARMLSSYSAYNTSSTYVPALRVGGNCAASRCPAPNAVLSAIDTNTATLTWVPGDAETSWLCQYKSTSAIAWTNAGVATSTSRTFSGLTHSSGYNFRVGVVCGLDTSWSNIITAYTDCRIATVPFNENFDSYTASYSRWTENPCWTTLNYYPSNTNLPYITSSTRHGSTGNSLYFYPGYANQPQFAVLPQLSGSISNLTVSFWLNGNANAKMTLGVMTDPYDTTTFVPMYTVPSVPNTWTSYEVPLTSYSGNGQYIAFRAGVTTSYGYAIYLDDVNVMATPSCARPQAVSVAAITHNSATVTLTDTSNLNNYRLFYTNLTTQAIDSVNATSTTVNLTGLTPGTQYRISAIGLCSDGGRTFAAEATFFTSCVQLTRADMPFIENFDSYQTSTFDNPCWRLLDFYSSSGNTYPSLSTSYSATAGGRSLYFYCYDNSQPEFAVLPAINSLQGLSVEFKLFYSSYSSTYTPPSMQVGVMTNPNDTTTFTTLGTYTPSLDSQWEEFDLDLTNYTGTANYVAFRCKRASGYYASSSIYLDDIAVRVAPSCARPQGISIVSQRSTSVTVSIDDTANVNNYFLTLTSNNTIDTVRISSRNYTFTHLTPLTSYRLSAYAFCSDGTTTRSTTISFATGLCDSPITGASVSDSLATSTTYYGPIYGYYYENTYNEILIDSAQLADLAGQDISYLGIKPTQIRNGYYDGVTIYLSHVTDTTLSRFAYNEDSVVAVFTGDITFSQENMINYITLDTSFRWDGHRNILVSIYRSGSPSSSYSTDYFAARSGSSSNPKARYYTSYSSINLANLRNVTSTASYYTPFVQLISCNQVCLSPRIAGVSAVDYQGATASWTSSASQFQVSYKAVNEMQWSTDSTVSSYSFTFSGLHHATRYMFRVRAICDTNEFSEWETGFFTTDSLPCFAPTDLANTSSTFTTASFSWTPGTSETIWQLHVWDAAFDSTYSVNTNPVTIGGLAAGMTYNAAIRALCGGGAAESDFSDTISFTTSVCAVPSNIVPSDITAHTVLISWEGSAASYEVQYGDPNFPAGTGVTRIVNENSCLLTGLEAEYDYHVIVRAICEPGVSSEYSDRIPFRTTVGINSVDDVHVAIYPNPASSSTTISVSGLAGSADLYVVDLSGRTVLSQTLTCNDDCTATLSVSHLPAGTYFVRIQSAGVNAVRKLVVK